MWRKVITHQHILRDGTEITDKCYKKRDKIWVDRYIKPPLKLERIEIKTKIKLGD